MSCAWFRWVGCGHALVGLALLAGCPGLSARRGGTAAPVTAAEVTLGALQLLTDRPLTLPPDRFEPSGRLFGLTVSERCLVFRTDGAAYMGEYPLAACAAWPAGLRRGGASLRELQPHEQAVDPSALDNRLNSPMGKREAVWRGADLQVWAGAQPLSRYIPSCSGPCRPIVAVAWSPDGELLALAHSADPRVVIFRVRDGGIEREQSLLAGFSVLPGLLAWSPSGQVAIAGLVKPPGEEAVIELGAEEWTLTKKKVPPLRAFVWSTQSRPASLPLDDLESGRNVLTLDPAGRYLFLSGNGIHDAQSLEGYDLRNGVERVVYFHTARDIGQMPTHTETVASAWLPGRYPLWETVEAHIPEEGERTYTVWRLYTRPDLEGPRLERIDLPEAPPARCESRRVLPDGRNVGPADPNDTYDSCGRNALDPSGTLRGLAKDEVQRVDDGLRLQVGVRGCLSTETGFYSCLELASERRYVVGTDPLHALGIRGDQLAPLLLRRHLLIEYLQGQPLAAPPKDQLLGLPPQLRVERVVPGPVPSVPTEVTFLAADGGSGLGPLHLYRDGELLGLPTRLHEGQQTVTLPLLNGSCHELRAYACNAAGLMCSPVAVIAPCKSTTKADDSE